MDDKRVRESWSELVRDTIGDTAFNVVAEQVGVSANTISNWVRGENYRRPDGYNVFRFAKAFGIPVPEALVRAGIGDEDDYSGEIRVKPDINELSTTEMLAEVMKRERDESAPKGQPQAGATKLRLAPEVNEAKRAKAASRAAKVSRGQSKPPL